MKTISLHSIVALLIVFLLSACNNQNEIIVGFSLGPDHERWDKDRDLLTEKLENSGAKIIIREAGNDENTQEAQIKELANENINVLIIAPVNSETCGEVVNEIKAVNPNLKIIAYDRIIKNCDLDLYVSFDNIKVGELQADYLTKVKPQGNYAILGGSPDDYNSQLLKLGQMNILQPLITRGDVKIVLDSYVEAWDSKNAYDIINQYLGENKNLDAVIASSDAIAMGVSQALMEHELCKKVLLSGQDAEASACKRIAEGKQTMTVYKYIESLATATAGIAIQMAKNEPMPNSFITMNNGKTMVPAMLLPSMIQVHDGNIRMTVIADGYLNSSDVFGN